MIWIGVLLYLVSRILKCSLWGMMQVGEMIFVLLMCVEGVGIKSATVSVRCQQTGDVNEVFNVSRCTSQCYITR